MPRNVIDAKNISDLLHVRECSGCELIKLLQLTKAQLRDAITALTFTANLYEYTAKGRGVVYGIVR